MNAAASRARCGVRRFGHRVAVRSAPVRAHGVACRCRRVPGLLRRGWCWLRAPANEVAFALRATLRLGRGQPRRVPSAVSDDALFPAAESAERAVAQALAHRFDLAPLAAEDRRVRRANLARLDALERLSRGITLPHGPDDVLRAVDIGCGDFHYAVSLQQGLSRHGGGARRVVLRGIEVDGYGLYRDGHSRADHARARAAAASVRTSLVRFEVADATRFALPPQDVVTLFFPFLTRYACLAWGAPLSRFAPDRLLRCAVAALRPGGLLVVANQTVAEHAALLRRLRGLPVIRIARRWFRSALLPPEAAAAAAGQVGSIWLRQSDIPSGKPIG